MLQPEYRPARNSVGFNLHSCNMEQAMHDGFVARLRVTSKYRLPHTRLMGRLRAPHSWSSTPAAVWNSSVTGNYRVESPPQECRTSPEVRVTWLGHVVSLLSLHICDRPLNSTGDSVAGAAC